MTLALLKSGVSYASTLWKGFDFMSGGAIWSQVRKRWTAAAAREFKHQRKGQDRVRVPETFSSLSLCSSKSFRPTDIAIRLLGIRQYLQRMQSMSDGIFRNPVNMTELS